MRRETLCALSVLLGAYGCGDKAKGEGEGTTAAREAERRVAIAPRECSGGGREVDVNNDGTADLKHKYEGERRVCSALDMNFDGSPDVLRFYAQDGTATEFEQHDFDFDGKLDEQAFYESGKLVRRELDTNFDTLVDTWLWCEGPLVTRAERARHRPGRIDTWEHFEQGALVTAEYDTNNDGRVDKWETFEAGRLRESRQDTDGDGEPDVTEDVPDRLAGQTEARYTCDGNPLPEPTKPAAPAAAETAGGEEPEAPDTADEADAPQGEAQTEDSGQAPERTGDWEEE